MVDLVVLDCVLRATAKKGRQLFVLPPPVFSSRSAPALRSRLEKRGKGRKGGEK